MQLKEYGKFLEVARGEREADLILSKAKIVNVFTEEIYLEDVVIYKDTIVGLGKGYKAKEVLNLEGRYLLPGFLESHIHIESTFLNPAEFAKVVARWGTCCVVCDPHEIANVLGRKGIELFLQLTEDLPVDIFFMAPSCVPASNFETSGAVLTSEDIDYLFSHHAHRFLGLAEVMNYPGAYLGDLELLKKIELAQKRHLAVDGHAPLLSGKLLNAYILAGAKSDHECSLLEEAKEKLRKGMHIFIREGSSEKNLESLMPLIKTNSERISLVTDDRHADELYYHGHLNYNLKKCIQLGIDPVKAIKLVTINPASYFKLNKYGAIAPGYKANLVVVNDLQELEIEKVFLKGKSLEKHKFDKKIDFPIKKLDFSPITEKDFHIPQKGDKIRIIEIIPNQIITNSKEVLPTIIDDRVVSDITRDIVKIAVIERHKNTGNIGLGFVQGLQLEKGSLASTVAHDSHNLIVAGVDDKDMVVATNFLREQGGGLAVVVNQKVCAYLALPLAGLMSLDRAEEVVKKLKEIDAEVKKISRLGSLAFMYLSFLALPVIPKLKITDRGLFDGEKFSFTSLFNS
jgi:adenine deaminase